MQNLNTVTLIGRVGVDPESKEVNGAPVCQFRIATNRVWVDPKGEKKEQATWHRIVCWNKQAETCQQFVHKGMLVFVTGSLETREYEKNGEKRSITEIRAQQVGFLSGRNDNGGGQAGDERGGFQSAPASQHRGYDDGRGRPAQSEPRGGYGGGRSFGGHVADDEVPF